MAQDSQNIDSLYDFLYLDRGRLSAFMAQVFDDGVLTASKKTEQTADAVNGAFEAGIPTIMKGSGNSQTTNTVSQEMQFDASWTLPLNVLDGLSHHGFIQRGLASARIGQLRLVCGTVSVLDIKLLQQMWMPMIDMFLKEMLPPGSTSKQTGAMKAQYKSIGAIVERLPQAVQMYLTELDGDKAWMTLNNEFMIVNPDELALKHGGYIAGEWHVLGVVDAVPDYDQTYRGELPEGMTSAMITMLDAVRQVVGRPAESYGMTPILIFRQINKD